MQLTNDQLEASTAFTGFLMDDDEKYFVISGGAGSGKSTLIKHLLDTVENEYKMVNLLKKQKQKQLTIALTATTNKAVAVLREMENVEPKTIHSFMGLTIRPNYGTGEEELIPREDAPHIYEHLIIIDEAGLIDKPLFDYIDKNTTKCKIIFVGDQYQLAPVGYTETIMEQLSCPKVELKQIVRNTGIIKKSGEQFKNTVKTGAFKAIFSDGKNLHHVTPSAFRKYIDKAFLHQNYDSSYAKVLTWTNGKAVMYNQYIRKLKGYGSQLVTGETAVTMKPIMNGRVRYHIDAEVEIIHVEPAILRNISGCYITLACGQRSFLPDSYQDTKKLLKTFAKYKNWEEYFNVKDSWFDLRSSYASTVHKSQGSTYKNVFIDLADIGKCYVASDTARMLYVAITRASDNVIVCGNLPPRYGGK